MIKYTAGKDGVEYCQLFLYLLLNMDLSFHSDLIESMRDAAGTAGRRGLVYESLGPD